MAAAASRRAPRARSALATRSRSKRSCSKGSWMKRSWAMRSWMKRPGSIQRGLASTRVQVAAGQTRPPGDPDRPHAPRAFARPTSPRSPVRLMRGRLPPGSGSRRRIARALPPEPVRRRERRERASEPRKHPTTCADGSPAAAECRTAAEARARQRRSHGCARAPRQTAKPGRSEDFHPSQTPRKPLVFFREATPAAIRRRRWTRSSSATLFQAARLGEPEQPERKAKCKVCPTQCVSSKRPLKPPIRGHPTYPSILFPRFPRLSLGCLPPLFLSPSLLGLPFSPLPVWPPRARRRWGRSQGLGKQYSGAAFGSSLREQPSGAWRRIEKQRRHIRGPRPVPELA
jgi:hypothetical protein